LHQPGVIEVASSSSGLHSEAVLFAPGRDVLTLLPGGHYDFASGASIATANVTGVVALLLANNPDLSAGTTRKLLRDTSLHDSVDACAAVVAAAGRGSCEPYVPATEARSPL
jgi:subtilisin family serine protease